MLEVALIKMCRPQMEVRDDKLALERIRAVEEKLERGDFTAMIPKMHISIISWRGFRLRRKRLNWRKR